MHNLKLQYRPADFKFYEGCMYLFEYSIQYELYS